MIQPPSTIECRVKMGGTTKMGHLEMSCFLYIPNNKPYFF
jgi:hypothetical protein